MAATPESRARTRAFSRVIGPYIAIATGIVAYRLPQMGDLDFFGQPIVVWAVGALLLFFGLVIIAHHSIWSTAPSVVISLFGWLLALRGFALMAAPDSMQRGVQTSMEVVTIVRFFFAGMVLVGVWLTWVGYGSKTFAPPSPGTEVSG